MRTLISQLLLAAAILVHLPLNVQGQPLPFFEDDADASLWGVSGSYTTSWIAPKEFRWLIGAENLDLQGVDYRIGFARGSVLGGEWGLSYVHQPVKEGSTIDLVNWLPTDANVPSCSIEAFGAGDCGVFYETKSGLFLRGFAFHKWAPFTTIAERVQIGINVEGGAGWYRGTASRRVVNMKDPASAIADEFVGESVSDVMGSELTLPRRFDTPAPIFNLDFGVAGIVAEGVKVRGGIGLYGFPGKRAIYLSGSYFFGRR